MRQKRKVWRVQQLPEGYYRLERIVNHTSKIFALSNDLPIIVEIVDETEKIEDFIEIVDKLFKKSNCGGLTTIENIRVLNYVTKK